jgi:gliding motility-associated-like protein
MLNYGRTHRNIFLFCVLLICFAPGGVFGQTAAKHTAFQASGDIFGTRGFIENKGQFDNVFTDGTKVLFLYEHAGEKVYLTSRGLVYDLRRDSPKADHEAFEAAEWGHEPADEEPEWSRVFVRWTNASPSASVVTDQKQGHYFTYGAAEYNSSVFKQVTYKDLYPGIDLVLTLPDSRSRGIKYYYHVIAGADVEKIVTDYSGDIKGIQFQNDGSLMVQTAYGDIVDEAPVSYYADGEPLKSQFELDGSRVTLSFPDGRSPERAMVIDPWVTAITSLSSTNYAFDVDFDFVNNTYLYGGNGPFRIANYNINGTLQWTFSGTVINPNWVSNPVSTYISNFGVNKFTGQSFVGQAVQTAGAQIIRVSSLGNYDNFISSQSQNFREIWDLGFHCQTADVFILGGGTFTNTSAATINTVNGQMNIASFNPTITGCCLDVVSHAIDDQGNIFVIYAGPTVINNKIGLINNTFNGHVWLGASGYTTFGEVQNKTGFTSSGVSGNGFNSLAVNANYLYYYDGSNLAAYNKTTGTMVASTAVGLTVKQQAGIVVDDCNNLYIGGNGSILSYHFNGTSFSTLTAIGLSVSTQNQFVYDIKYNRTTKMLYVCGSGFAGTYSAINSLSCPNPLGVCLFSQGGLNAITNSITCASLGTATISVTGGIGPFTYTWWPSMQTGSVMSGLGPGTHTVLVYDAGYGATYTTLTNFVSPLPLTGSLNISHVTCNGANNGSVSVTNIAGGSGNHTYKWFVGNNSYTTTTISGLSPGGFTVVVTDQLTACSFTLSSVITQPPSFSLSIIATPTTACAGTPVTLISVPSGGTPGYTYSWTAGPPTITYAATGAPGPQVFTLTAFDGQNCSLTRTISVPFLNTPTLSVANASICPGKTATLSVSGANTYTWSNLVVGSTNSVTPSANTVYTVTGSSAVCASTTTAQVVILPLPQPVFSGNSPVCSGKPLLMTASGGVAYAWTGPSGFVGAGSSMTVPVTSPSHAGVYQFTVTGANSCTASASGTITINDTPTISATGSAACETGTLLLQSVASCTSCNFYWTGPSGFVSQLKNPVIVFPPVALTGSYNLLVTSAEGCTAAASASATVFANPVAQFAAGSPVCEGASLSFTAASALGSVYNWTGPNGFFSTLQNPVITNAQPAASGSYTLKVINGLCQHQVSHPAYVNPLPGALISGSTSVCRGKTISLTALPSPSTAGCTWQGPAGYQSFGATMLRGGAIEGWSGTYAVTVTDQNQCSRTISTLVSVYPNPVLSVADQTVCLREPATLAATGADTYQWIGPGLLNGSGGTVTIGSAQFAAPVNYFVTGYSAQGCSVTAGVTLFTKPLPVPNISLDPSNRVCVGNTVKMSGSGGEIYEWRGPGLLYLEGKEVTLPLWALARGGDFTLTVTDAKGCRQSTDTSIVTVPLPDGWITHASKGVCVPFCADFRISSLSPGATVSWQTPALHTTEQVRVCYHKPGRYTISASLYDKTTTCANTLTYAINAWPQPVADFSYTPEHPVEHSEPVTFYEQSQPISTGSEDGTSFSWYFLHDRTCNTEGASASCLFEHEGSYPVALEVKTSQGCSDTIVKKITIAPDISIFVPNSFTPNEDNRNETFYPVVRGIEKITFQVFNRWGGVIFSTNTIGEGWDGFFRDKISPEGVYAWKLIALDRNGNNRQLIGHVTLYR